MKPQEHKLNPYDHRVLGQKLELFALKPHDIGKGLILWLPNGMIIREELENWAKDIERKAGYKSVKSPVIGKEALYECSGHLAYYKDDMYAPIEIEDERYYLRPMNCPHHHHIYSLRPRSYRELPYRIAEYGEVFRYEASGALSGLIRPRGFCINDAHIYCSQDQVFDEFVKVLEMYQYYYDILGIKDYYMRLSKADFKNSKKYAGDPAQWKWAEDIARRAMIKVDMPFIEADGEAAFYGPKIDVQIKSAVGQEYSISTNQLDFMAAEKFDLKYVDQDGADKPLCVIHRAPLGSHERFIAYLIEHFKGAFPFWLVPEQIRVLPIADRHADYAALARDRLFAQGFRAEVDDRSISLNARLKDVHRMKVPYVLILGDAEVKNNKWSLKSRDGDRLNDQNPDDMMRLFQRLKDEKALSL